MRPLSHFCAIGMSLLQAQHNVSRFHDLPNPDCDRFHGGFCTIPRRQIGTPVRKHRPLMMKRFINAQAQSRPTIVDSTSADCRSLSHFQKRE